MGILNATPDSFSDGGALGAVHEFVAHARRLVAEGAHVLDLGAESTRPGFVPVPAEVQLERLLPVVRALTAALPRVALSIDTRDSAVARACLQAGASIINDVSALADPRMGETVAEFGAGVVLMHGFVAPGAPAPLPPGAADATLAATDAPAVVLAKVGNFLAGARVRAMAAGVAPERIWLDPGLGFGKSAAQNWVLTACLGALTTLGCPVLYGPSRKRFLGQACAIDAPQDRDAATAAACAIAVAAGAAGVRVHSPGAVRDAVAVGRAAAAAAKTAQGPNG